MKRPYQIPPLPLPIELESKAVLRQLSGAHRALAELKGAAAIIPNEGILVSTLTLQEAKESSEVENIVTTQDELYRAEDDSLLPDTAPAKEVLRYREALLEGFASVKEQGMLTNKIIKRIQQRLEGNEAGFRRQAGTVLKDGSGAVVYTPPQTQEEVEHHMSHLEHYLNDPQADQLDPLIRMAVMHHQFESIHPFYDGNGRTGRILNVLYLVQQGLLDQPILYLSRYITSHKGEYYRLLQAVRDSEGDPTEAWQAWVLFILKGIEQTARQALALLKGIAQLMQEYKQILRPQLGKKYRHELLNNLFYHPYTKIEYMRRDLGGVSRLTATKRLEEISNLGLLRKIKVGSENYYINEPLMRLFLEHRTLFGSA